MKFNVGQVWKTGSGKVFTIIRINQGGEYPILAIDEKKVLNKFDKDGRAVHGFPNPSNDLKEQV